MPPMRRTSAAPGTAESAQSVGNQSAAPGIEFGGLEWGWISMVYPPLHDPEVEKLADKMAYLGRGGEIPLGAESLPARAIAVPGM